MTGPAAVEEEHRRLATGVLRSLGGLPGHRLQGDRLEIDGRPQPDIAPHLRAEPIDNDDPAAGISAWRAIADGWGIRSRLGDRLAYLDSEPELPLARALYSILEQFRVESLLPATLPGSRRNLRDRFRLWSQRFQGSRLAEGQTGIELFAFIWLARSTLLAEPVDAVVEDRMEAFRHAAAGELRPTLRVLRALRDDPIDFAAQARILAERMAVLLVTDVRTGRVRGAGIEDRLALWLTEAGEGGPGNIGDPRESGIDQTGYRVFTTGHDRVAEPTALVRPAKVATLRTELDERVRRMAVNPRQLAAAFMHRWATPEPDGFEHDLDEGLLDPRRLNRLAINDDPNGVFRQPALRTVPDAEVVLLIDCTGSMKSHRQVVFPAVEVICRAWSLAEIRFRVHGFSTATFNGGQSLRDWKSAGRPAHPGRIADHLDLQIADSKWSWRRNRLNLAAASAPVLHREGLLGEAMAARVAELRTARVRHRELLVITDGAPHETATVLRNGPDYLADHAAQVVGIGGRAGIRISALGLGSDLSWAFDRWRPASDPSNADAVLQTAAALLLDR